MNWLNLINNRPVYILLCLTLGWSGCSWLNFDNDEEEKDVLAIVNDEKLYADALSDIDFSSNSVEDSIRFLEIFVDRWVRDKLLLSQAKDKMQDHPKVQELVEKYRNSLLLHEYEKQVIREKLDSSISQSEMRSHYEEKKESYILNQHIYKAKWIYTNSSNINLDSVRVIWNRNDTSKNESLASLAELYAKSFNLDPERWWKGDELVNILKLPVGQWNSIELEETIIIEKDDGNLILVILDEKGKGEYAPLSFVADNIQRFILHQRKEEILKKVRNDLFRSALENNTVKINIK